MPTDAQKQGPSFRANLSTRTMHSQQPGEGEKKETKEQIIRNEN